MKRLYIFRTNLKNLEYYHDYLELNEFKNKCHDFYLLQGILFIENNYFDEVIIFRLSDKDINPIVFEIKKDKKFIQKWVNNFNEVFKYPKPDVSFFRGGFKEYCEITKKDPNFFGLKLYLAAGKRILPQYGGIYDKILIEDERDNINKNCIPFYKTANPNIFYPMNIDNKKYDLCIISNFTQLKYKGTDEIINGISRKNEYFKKLKICHIGNNPEVGINLCKKNNVNNIEFLGKLTRPNINLILNESKFGIVASSLEDGCPRIITEILCSGTPLFLKEDTRLLSYYKKCGVVQYTNLGNFFRCVFMGFENYSNVKNKLLENINYLSMNDICKMNINLWGD